MIPKFNIIIGIILIVIGSYLLIHTINLSNNKEKKVGETYAPRKRNVWFEERKATDIAR